MCLDGRGPSLEVCNGIDDDCDGVVDGGCIREVPIDVLGDCVTVTCPASNPHPIGCRLTFRGASDRGCVANVPNQSTVFLKEGDRCNAGRVSGTLRCSAIPGVGLNADNCVVGKKTPQYAPERKECVGE